MEQVIEIPPNIYQARIEYLKTGIDSEGQRERVDVEHLLAHMQGSGSSIVLRMVNSLDAILKEEQLPPTEKTGDSTVRSMLQVRQAYSLFTNLFYEGEQEHAVMNYFTHLATLCYA